MKVFFSVGYDFNANEIQEQQPHQGFSAGRCHLFMGTPLVEKESPEVLPEL